MKILDTNIWELSAGRVSARVRDPDSVRLRIGKSDWIRVHAHAPVGEGDLLELDNGQLWVTPKKTKVRIPLTPVWQRRSNLSVGDSRYPLVIKEIETSEEMEGFRRLKDYHYRGAGGPGRSVPLIAKIDSWQLPQIVGFVELTSSFLVNTARKDLFDLGFAEPSLKVAWAKWDSRAASRYTNLIARISRCVVYPELRGLGVARELIGASLKYARERWHYGGMRPVFVEITADMLRYFPFVRDLGFRYIGDTEGNEHRLSKDMTYLLRRSIGQERNRGMPKGGGGILSLQRSYAVTLGDIVRKRKTSIEQLLRILRLAPEKLSDDEWVLLHRVHRRPKPTYMAGLTERASAFLRKKSLAMAKKRKVPELVIQTVREEQTTLDIEGLKLSVVTKPPSSARARKVQEAFGIVSKQFEACLVRNLSLTLKRGSILLVTGPSGTGKSLLLRTLAQVVTRGRKRNKLPTSIRASFNSSRVKSKIGWLRSVKQDVTPIDLLAEHSLESTLRQLASAGLAEPQLYIRRVSQLSEGQAYRLALAVAVSKNPDILFADGFCEPLDKFSTAAVCKRLHLLAKADGPTVIVATANPDPVLSSLKPDNVLVLSSTGDVYWRGRDVGSLEGVKNENEKGNHGRAT